MWRFISIAFRKVRAVRSKTVISSVASQKEEPQWAYGIRVSLPRFSQGRYRRSHGSRQEFLANDDEAVLKLVKDDGFVKPMPHPRIQNPESIQSKA